MPEKSFQIRAVRSAADLEAVVQLFNAYASAVGIDLGYQDFDKELATRAFGRISQSSPSS
jgi:hypothetical protein